MHHEAVHMEQLASGNWAEFRTSQGGRINEYEALGREISSAERFRVDGELDSMRIDQHKEFLELSAENRARVLTGDFRVDGGASCRRSSASAELCRTWSPITGADGKAFYVLYMSKSDA